MVYYIRILCSSTATQLKQHGEKESGDRKAEVRLGDRVWGLGFMDGLGFRV